jgi:hypothetical protein
MRYAKAVFVSRYEGIASSATEYQQVSKVHDAGKRCSPG